MVTRSPNNDVEWSEEGIEDMSRRVEQSLLSMSETEIASMIHWITEDNRWNALVKNPDTSGLIRRMAILTLGVYGAKRYAGLFSVNGTS